MLVRVRTRDGTERLDVPDGCTVAELRRQIEKDLGTPDADQKLSLNQGLLLSKSPENFVDMKDLSRTLKSLGVQHGGLVFLTYSTERQPTQTYQPPPKPYGAHMTVEELIAKQTRISRQEVAHVASVSLDRHAANAFQQYAGGTLSFTIKRCGIMYGTVDEAGAVSVDAVYEPSQEGSATDVTIISNQDEDKRADFLATALGLKRVGWIVTQSNAERAALGEGHTLASADVQRMAAFQAQYGERFATAVVSSVVPPEGGPAQVHFEAFQVSDQLTRLWQDGIMAPAVDPKISKFTKPVMIGVKDVTEVDNDFFLVPLKILDHGSQLGAAFPVENRLIAQTTEDLKSHLQRSSNKPYVQRLADFHLLLFLSRQLDLGTDMALLAEAVKVRGTIQEGYQLIINSIAGIV